MAWTEERVCELKTMWAEGKSASKIAKALGCFTRNAVIGKIHRLGLADRRDAAISNDSSKESQSPSKEKKVEKTASAKTPPAIPKQRRESVDATPPTVKNTQEIQEKPADAFKNPKEEHVLEHEKFVPELESRNVLTTPEIEERKEIPENSDIESAPDDDEKPTNVLDADDQESGLNTLDIRLDSDTKEKFPETEVDSDGGTARAIAAAIAEVDKNSLKISLLDLTEKTCKWPIGDPSSVDFFFCGLPSIASKPYCSEHAAVAYHTISTRRDRHSRANTIIAPPESSGQV
jgi:GcrA cell cycle regulator